jgi:hypothetical protein
LQKRSLIKEEGTSQVCFERVRRLGEASMNMLIHLKRHGEVYLHLHPLDAMFSVIASFGLAVLVVLMLVSSAR